MTHFRATPVLLAAALCIGLVPGLAAQDPSMVGPPTADAAGLTDRAAIQTRKAELEQSQLLPEGPRTEIVALYDSALRMLDAAAEWDSRRVESSRLLAEAPSRLEALRAELAAQQLVPEPPVVPEGLTVDELDQRAAQAEAELDAARAEVAAQAAERAQRDARRDEVPAAAAEASARLAQIEEEVAATSGAALGDPVEAERERARRTQLLARRTATQAELSALDQENQGFDAQRELNTARRERAGRRVAVAEMAVRVWNEAEAAGRQREAERAAEEARRAAAEAADADPVVSALAQENQDLAERRTGEQGLLARIESIRAELTGVREALARVTANKASVETKFKNAGQTPAIGLLMVKHRAELPEVSAYRKAQRLRQEETAEVQLRLIETQEDLAELTDDLEAKLDEVLAALAPGRDPDEVAEIERAVRRRLEARRTLLQEVELDYDEYVDVLADLEGDEKLLITETEAFAAYIDERVLWVRLQPPLHAEADLADKCAAAAAWLFEPAAWVALLTGAGAEATDQPLATGLWGLMVLALFLLKPGLRRRIDEAAESVTRLRTDRFRLTVRTLLDTALMALPLPLVMWQVGRLIVAGDVGALATAQAGSVGAALQVTAAAWAVIEFVNKASRKRGLFEAHFRYAPESLKRMRTRLRVLVLIGLPLVFLDGAFATTGAESLGRLAFIGGELVLIWFLVSTLRSPKGVIGPHLERHPEGWVARTRWLALLAGVGLPLTLATLVELGYVYTAEELERRLDSTFLLIFGLVMGYGLTMRALTVVRRRLALEQYLRRRAAATEEGAEGAPADEDEIDVAAVSEQSLRLLSTAAVVVMVAGTWWIWADVLPALRVLDDVRLWERTEEVVLRTTNPSGGLDLISLVPEEVPVTLGDALLALVWVILTVVAARNGPGLLEITVLQRLPMQRAGRYATTTILRYVIVILGLGGAFQAIGVGWGQVQWLAAAVTVGLGFGLQEIFANFVSGLILLFERPVRVGDTVTVGDVTGVVTRIRMRATTIMTWSETELVVPNKEFITSQLVNWTLSNSMLRVIVKVGIAYGSDTELATKLLYKVARENAHVLDDAGTQVVFRAFGDSTLDFELRCYVDSPEVFRMIHHPLNTAIDKAFRAAGIEIAFPQRDLHLRTSDISLRLERGRPAGRDDGTGEVVPTPADTD